MLTLIALACVSAVLAVQKLEKNFELDEHQLLLDENRVLLHNKQGNTWTASTEQGDYFKGLTVKQAKVLLGARLDTPDELRLPSKEEVLGKDDLTASLPDSFDSRKQWPHCETIRRIRDQSACGSCWAVSAAEAASDRECIEGGHRNLTVSAAQLLSCCHSCGYGCDGGFPPAAWQYIRDVGLVAESCDPYPFPPCSHHVTPGPNGPPACPKQEYKTPLCRNVPSHCAPGANGNNTVYKVQTAYEVNGGEEAIMREILEHGPVQTAFTVYADFPSYKSGVYQHTYGGALGGHAVKIIGWGVENGEKYWEVANSWNTNWGNKGFFRILRGVNECGFESQTSQGLPYKN